MKNQGTITGLQIGALIFVYVFSTTIAFLLAPMAKNAPFDGVYGIVLAAVAGTALTAFSLRYALLRPSTYVGIEGAKVVGKVGHIAILLLSAFFFLHLSAHILREFTDFFVPTYLKETPSVAVAVLVMAAVASMAQSGVPVAFRFAQGCFFVIGFLFFIKPLFFIPEMSTPMWHEFTRIHDWKALWSQTYSLIPWYGELVLLAYIVPLFDGRQKVRKAVWIGSMAGTYIFVSEFLLMIVFFGPQLSGALMYPALELSGFLHLGDFVHNMDAIIVSIWFAGLFIKLGIVFAVGTLLVSQALGLSHYKPITFPLAAFVVALSVVLARYPAELARSFDRSWATFALFVECLVFLYPIISRLKGGQRRSE
ncbi:GerAB/ArcD/ProY family transporter [Cohnella hashimotonis]|uniref:GerAB/ArcD/ProY family transporter n=1 Tax=Cohnella hashimotonis TaxID=2826895 RepID=A0ABT6TVL9_9BACL|nr:GerAB/ArcD/ProY family transporter [Cohnella hashimotonis]MDI4649842.1 GerAB/ArcD/ProY family transporter [Cohnella hashimotonis]